MFIFIFTVLALGEKCARFVHFIHGSFTELVNRERLHEHARYATRTCTHTHNIYILCVWAVFIHLFREQDNHIRRRSDAPTALTPDTTVHTRLGGITRHIFFGKIEQMFGQAVKGSASRGLEGGARRRGWVTLGRWIARHVVCESR